MSQEPSAMVRHPSVIPKREDISVVIPIYNPNEGRLNNCLEAVRSSSYKPLEIILVDDGSTTAYHLTDEWNYTIIKRRTNKGPAIARNVGAKEAKGDILCFVDSDVRLRRDTLERIAGKFVESNVAAVQTIYSERTCVRNFLSQYQNLQQHYSFKTINHEALSTLSSYAIAIRKDIFFELGGFEESVHSASIEDELLGVELYHRGHTILLAKDISVEHMACYTFRSLTKRMFTLGREGAEHYKGHGTIRKMELVKTHHRVSRVASVLMSPVIFIQLLLCLITPQVRFQACVTILIFLAMNGRFFFFLYRMKGPVFVLKSIITYFVMCLSTFAGLITGSWSYRST